MKKTQEQINYKMQGVKAKDSEIEKILRNALWNKGYRYRKNVKDVFGHPDIVFKSKKVAIFCDSEFWHGYDWERKKNEIKTRQDFWIPKIERNMQRDKEDNMKLTEERRTDSRLWGTEIKKQTENCVKEIEKCIKR